MQRVARRGLTAHGRQVSRRGRLHDAQWSTAVSGPIIACLATVVAALGTPSRAVSQARELRSYGSGAPEAKLMLYYSSTVAFSPIGVPFGAMRPSTTAFVTGPSSPRLEAAVELSYLPPLSTSQRTPSSDKPEATNLAPLFARPRVAARLPGGLALELSWIPPVRLFDVKANLFAGAVSRSFDVAWRVRIIPRASFLTGRVEGPITCNRETARDRGVALATYFAFVCYSNNSRDYFEPRHVSGELLVARSSMNGNWEPYATAGARAERTRFDVGVIRRDGTRDPDEPVLEVKTTRAYGTVGTSWLGLRRTRLAAELYYAPGSTLTARALAGVHVW